MDQVPAAMDKHLEVVQCHPDAGVLLGASSLTGRYWLGSLWYYQVPEVAPDVEKCTAGVQLEAGLRDAAWVENNKVLVGLDTGGIALWELTDDFHTFIQLNSETQHDDIVSSVCVCAGAKRVASASHDRSIKIWDLETFTSVHTYKAHGGRIHSLQNHPTDPDVFLSAAQDGQVFLWDARKPKPVTVLETSPLEGIPTCVAWQPESHVFAVGSEAGELVVRDTRAAVGSPLKCFPHTRSVSRIQFSPLRPHLIGSVSEDCTLSVFSIKDDFCTRVYQSSQHVDFVQGLSWAPTTLTLYSCAWDARLLSHTVSESILEQSNAADTGPTKMEVNGVFDQNVGDGSGEKMKGLKTVSNGDSDLARATEGQTT